MRRRRGRSTGPSAAPLPPGGAGEHGDVAGRLLQQGQHARRPRAARPGASTSDEVDVLLLCEPGDVRARRQRREGGGARRHATGRERRAVRVELGGERGERIAVAPPWRRRSSSRGGVRASGSARATQRVQGAGGERRDEQRAQRLRRGRPGRARRRGAAPAAAPGPGAGSAPRAAAGAGPARCPSSSTSVARAVR